MTGTTLNPGGIFDVLDSVDEIDLRDAERAAAERELDVLGAHFAEYNRGVEEMREQARREAREKAKAEQAAASRGKRKKRPAKTQKRTRNARKATGKGKTPPPRPRKTKGKR